MRDGDGLTTLVGPVYYKYTKRQRGFGLLPLLFQRVILHDQPLPQKLLPTIAIFIAPPAVGMLSWQSLTGTVDDPVGRVLFSAAMMFTMPSAK